MEDLLLKTVRVTGDIKVEVWQQGKKRKYAQIYLETGIIKSEKVDISTNDKTVILDAMSIFAVTNGRKEDYYKIIQDPYDDTTKARIYGISPYYLNNGCILFIEWIGKEPNPDFSLGTYSTADDVPVDINTPRWLDCITISSNSISKVSDWVDSVGHSDRTMITDKRISITLPNKVKEESNTLVWSTKNKFGTLDYSTRSENDTAILYKTLDEDIIKIVIGEYNKMITNLYGIPEYGLDLCSPDTIACSIIEYKSPLTISNDIKIQTTTPPQQPIIKTKFNIDGLTTPTIIKAKQNLPNFTIWISGTESNTTSLESETIEDVNSSNGLDESYIENTYTGKEEEWEPLQVTKDDAICLDKDLGSGSTNEPPITSLPATANQKDFIKTAINATLAKGESKGRCAKYTFNHAKNYVYLMKGKSAELGAKNCAGGNANNETYHANLQSIGYIKYNQDVTQKNSLLSKISRYTWEIGDVLVYWCTDGPNNESHVKYGHTQIFTGQSFNNYNWACDNKNNYGCTFVYNNRKGDTWHWIIFKAPKTARINNIA